MLCYLQNESTFCIFPNWFFFSPLLVGRDQQKSESTDSLIPKKPFSKDQMGALGGKPGEDGGKHAPQGLKGKGALVAESVKLKPVVTHELSVVSTVCSTRVLSLFVFILDWLTGHLSRTYLLSNIQQSTRKNAYICMKMVNSILFFGLNLRKDIQCITFVWSINSVTWLNRNLMCSAQHIACIFNYILWKLISPELK